MSEPYRPIDCSLHDELEAAATLRRPSELRYLDADGSAKSARGVIADVFARAGAEYLRLDDGLEIRLDRILSLDGRGFNDICSTPLESTE